MVGVDGSGVVERGGGAQRVMGDAVGVSRQAARALAQGLGGGRFEQWEFAAGEAQAMGQIGVALIAFEAGEVVAHDESLGERFVAGHGQAGGGAR